MSFRHGHCQACISEHFTVTETNGQDVVRCADCDTYDWCLPKSVSGKAQRSVRSRAALKPSDRAAILEAHGHSCVACGRGAPDVILHIDHLIPVDAAKKAGVYDELIEDQVNLAPMCEECNLGAAASLDRKSIRLMYRVLLLKSHNNTNQHTGSEKP